MWLSIFKDFDVVVNGKFVDMLITPYVRCHHGVNEFEFYFGVYNHKYFSMCPSFTLDYYEASGSSDDFRLATNDEKTQFFEDCRSFGYEWVIFQLAMEYMQYGWFSSLCAEIANIRRIELESKKNSVFEL